MKTILQLIPGGVAAAMLLLLAGTVHAQPAAPVAQAKAAFDQGDLATAEALLAPLATGTTPDAAACHQLALVRQRQKRDADAVALLEQATKLDPTKPDYFSALGIAVDVLIHHDIAAQGGWIPFSRFMELALYAPGVVSATTAACPAPTMPEASIERSGTSTPA